MKPSECTEVLERICAWWPAFKLTPGVTAQHFTALFNELETSKDELYAALSYLRTTGEKFYPAPDASDLERGLKAVRNARAGIRERTAEEVWSRVLNSARRGEIALPIGTFGSRALKSIGGLQSVRLSTDTELPFLRKAFIDAYSSISQSEQQFSSATFAHLSLVCPEAKKLLEGKL